MIVSLKTILQLAEADKKAVAAFNVTTLSGIRAVIAAAEETGQPVIIQFANAAHGAYISLHEIGQIMMQYAEEATVPVCVHLDHGANLNEIHEALELGFTGVMIDGSALPYEKNVAITNAAVELAQSYGASVEAEIGSMGREEFLSAGGSEADLGESSYTDPDQAARFVKDTGIDALACSFGTVHGIYLKAPKLDVDRIKVIREKTGKPVVMHGGSGLSDDDFRRCIANGVRKINFYTYAAKFAGDAVREGVKAAGDGNVYVHDIATWSLESMKKTYVHTISVFSNLKED